MPPTTQINIRRDTAAAFTAANPTLAFGEIAYETDTFRFKVGTGSTAWTALGYAAQNPTSLTVTDTTESTSTTTGALRVAGGVGIGGAVNIGGGMTITPNANAPTSNIAIGPSAGAAMQSGAAGNICIGENAGLALTTGDRNIVLGSNAMTVASTTNDIIAIGSNAFTRGTGFGNTAIGSNTLEDQLIGTNNTAIGSNALRRASTSISTFTTTPVAGGSGYTANQVAMPVTLVKKSGSDTFSGTVTALLTTNASGVVTAVASTPVDRGTRFTGTNVIFEPSGFGAGSGCEISIATLSSLIQTVAIGSNAGSKMVHGLNGIFIGSGVAPNATSANALAIGSEALSALTSGSSNFAIGTTALWRLSTGNFSTAIGLGAGRHATGGNGCYVGFRAGNGVDGSATGTSNTVVGADAMYNFTTASNATAVGASALFSLESGNQNVAVGLNAGRYRGTSTDALTNATNSVFIGYQARANGNSQSNQVVIGGSNAVGDGSNTTVVGTSATTQARIHGATFLSTGANGQSTQLGQATTLLSGLSGATVTATNLIPANSILLGVTARVTTAITGATTFDIGDGTTANRFGDDVAIALGTTANNCIAPALVTAATNVVLTANGSNFTGGAVRLTAHFMTLVAPTS